MAEIMKLISCILTEYYLERLQGTKDPMCSPMDIASLYIVVFPPFHVQITYFDKKNWT